MKRVQEAYKQIKENIKVQNTLTVDQFCDMLRDIDVSINIDSRKAMTKTKITLDKPVAEFLKGFENK